MRLTKRLLSAILVLVMVFSMLPLQAFASEVHTEDGGGTKIPVQGVRPQKAPTEDKVNGSTDSKVISVNETARVSKKAEWYVNQWRSSDDTIATVTKNSNGSATIKGIKPGTVTITEEKMQIEWAGTYWTTVQTIIVTVLSDVKGIDLPDELILKGQESKSLTATVTPGNAEGYIVDWSVADANIATVDAQGNVTPVAVGETTVTATIRGTEIRDTCKVRVVEPEDIQVTLSPLTLAMNQTGTMNVQCEPKPLASTLKWSITNPSDVTVAQIDADTGLITAVAEGTAAVTVTVTVGEKTFTAEEVLTVTATQQPTGISLNKTEVKLQGLNTVQLQATVLPEDMPEDLKVVTWESSTPGVATVDANGLVQAVAPGNATITAKTFNGLIASCEVTVEKLPDRQNTPVYVYLKIKADPGVSTDGWTLNQTGSWYTIGQINVPRDVLGDAKYGSGADGVAQDASDLIPYLPYIDLHSINKDVAAGVTLQNCDWELRRVSTGANNYQDAGWTWHMDGYLTLRNVTHTLTVKYQDSYKNNLREPLIISDLKAGASYDVEIPSFDGYTAVSFNNSLIAPGETRRNVKISGDATIIIQYKGDNANYSLHYVEKGTNTEIAVPTRITAELGQRIEAKDIQAPEIPNFTYANEITPDSLVVKKNLANNKFTLYYTRNQYDVTYKYVDPRTDEEVTVGPTKKGAGLTVKAEPKPTINGYEFVGWTDIDKNNSVTIGENGEFTMPNRDVTFTGSFTVPETQNYAVRATVKLGGAVLATAEDTEVTWTELGGYYGMDADGLLNTFWGLTLTDSTGMTFTWNPANPDAAKQYDADKEYHEVIITLEEGSPALVTLTYDANGGEGTLPEKQTYLKGTKATVTEAKPTRTGYAFTGWNTKQDGTGTPYGAKNEITLNESTTLYAQWEQMYQVTYQFDDSAPAGAVVPTDGAYYKEGDTVTVLQPTDVLNYTFNGWKDEEGKPVSGTMQMPDHNVTLIGSWAPKTATYTVKHYLETETAGVYPREPVETVTSEAVPIGSVIERADVTKSYDGYEPARYEPANDIEIGPNPAANVIKVYYKRSAYTVTYQVDGVVKETVEGVRYGTKHDLIREPSKDGYSFSQWSVTSGNATIQTEADGKYIIMPADDVTIVGNFTLNQYQVSYEYGIGNEYNGERNLPDSHKVNYGATNFLDAAPTETGYVFSGWYKNQECTEEFTSSDTMPANDVTAYGKFTKRTDLSYTVNYFWNGDKEKPFDTETTDGCTFGASVELTEEQLQKAGYTLVEKPETLTIGADSSKNVINVYYRKNVTVTAKDILNHEFGSEIPTLTASVLPADVELTTVYRLKTDADKDSPVDSYPIYFVDGAGNEINLEVEGKRAEATVDEENYHITFVPGMLTITASDSLSISAKGGSWTYDGNPHAGTVTVKRGDEVVSAELSYRVKTAEKAEYGEWTQEVPEIQNVGTLYVEVKASLDNYVEKTATYTLTVNPRVVTITAPENVSAVYGQTMPVLAPTVAPTVQELPDDFYETVDYDMVCEATSTSPAGEYPISFTRDGQTVEGLVKYGNYDVNFIPGKLIITEADGLSISAKGGSWTYDGEFHGDVDVDVNLPGATLTYSTDGVNYAEDAPTIKDVSESGKTFYVKASLANYKDDIAEYTLTVTPKLVTVTSASGEKAYDGTPLTAGMKSETGWVGEEGAEYTFHASVTNVTTGEGVPNTFSYEAKEGTDLNNYVIKMVNGSLKVNPRVVTVKAPQDATATYGEEIDLPKEAIENLPENLVQDFGENVRYTMTVDAQKDSPVDSYPIYFKNEQGEQIQSSMTMGNYLVTFVPGTLTIQPTEDALSVQPFSYEGIYDGQSHGGEATVFVNGEKFTDATVTYYVSDSMNGPWEKLDTYPTIKDVDEFYVMVVAEHNNYNTAVECAHLHVIPRTVTVTAENADKVYGDADPTSFEAQVDGLLGGDTIDYQVARAEGEDADKYDITPTGEQNQGNYVVQYYSGEFTINPKPIKVKANNQTMTYGGDVPALTAQLAEGSALADRDAEKTLEEVIGKYTLAAQLPQDRPLVGRHTIDFTDEDGVRGNYLVTFVPGELTIEAPTSGEGTGIVTKTHEDKIYNPGDEVIFTISATNIYNQPATLTIVEQLENVVFDKVENVPMAPGETLTFKAQYQVTEADILHGALSNTIDWTIAPNEGSSIGGTVSDPVKLAGRNSAMTVEKTIEDQKDSYRVGDVISFQILVKNTGNVTLHNLELTDRLINANGRVTFTETNGASLSGDKLLLAQLAPGQQWTVKCSYTVTEADAGKNIGNAATVTPEDGPTITDETDKPASVDQRYTLTIRYLNTAGVSIHEDYTGRYHAGDRYEIASPAVAGYTLTADSVVRSGVMGEGDKTLVVVYDRVPAPAPDPDPEPDPDPAPAPDPDPDPAPNPDPDAPAPDPDPDPEADPAQQTDPQDNTEPVLQPGTYLEDPEDHTLTPIDEEETPLANVNLNGHTCCILHFLLMLAAMVVYGFDTKSRKKHQARIFELKRQLAMKDDQNDSQQS